MCVSASCSPPCAHGGTCMRWNNCLCPLGWTGNGCHTGTAPEKNSDFPGICWISLGLLTVLFLPQPCVNYPVLMAVAVWGLIFASVRPITAALNAFCVSNKTTNTSGISNSNVSNFWEGVELTDWFSAPLHACYPLLGIMPWCQILFIHSSPVFTMWLFRQLSALLPVKMEEDV